jgi:hypothetical protein
MRAILLPLLALATLAPPALAERPASGRLQKDPGLQCRAAIRSAERAAGIPEHLMAAIGRVESGRRGADGVVNPWPWSINAEGQDFVYDTKAQAIAGVQAQQARGVQSIDVGCMQVNLLYHPAAFATLDQAFDPAENARYAARFLVQLKAQTGAWEKATAWYHSANADLGEPYQRKVMAVLPEEKKQGGEDSLHASLAAAWGATLRPAQPDGTTPSGLAAAWGATLRPVQPDGLPPGGLRPRATRTAGMPTPSGRTNEARLVRTAYRGGPPSATARQAGRSPL